jgi:hypothetical protein
MRAKQLSWDETRERLETTIGRQREGLKTSSDENAALKRQLEQLQAEKREAAGVQAIRQEREELRREREKLDHDSKILDSSRAASKAETDRGLKALEEGQQQLDRGLAELKEGQQRLDRDLRALKEREEYFEAALDGLRETLERRAKEPRITEQHITAAQRVYARGSRYVRSLTGATPADSPEQPSSGQTLEQSTPESTIPSSAVAPAPPTAPEAKSWPAPEQLNAWIDAIAAAFPEVGQDARFVPHEHLGSLLGLEEVLRKTNRSSDLDITLAHVIGGAGSPPFYDVRLLPLKPPNGEPPHARLGGFQEGLWIQFFVAVRTRSTLDSVLIFAPPGAYDPISFASYSGLIANFPSSRFVINRLEGPARLRLDAKSNRYRVVEKMMVSFV